ncbi:MAG: hypothetical protein J6M17_11690 [Ruminococcus sp.]|nr:hypothetical protein [Ruminococcus sp.]MBP3797228.1 hypothetical protein [Ruminococcus sp.]
MKKQMIVTAVMSLVITLAGCGAANGSDNANNGSVTKKTSAADAASAQEETVSQEENKGEDNSEDKKTAEDKSDDKAKEKKSADEKTQGKKAASSEVSAIVGEWREFRGSETRFLNVYSDASFEVKSDTGSIITSGNITTETVDGIVKYSLNDRERGLWYVPFITYSIDGVDHLQTEENSAYEAVVFIRDTGDSGSDPSLSSELSPILGTWYDEDNAAGRTIT